MDNKITVGDTVVTKFDAVMVSEASVIAGVSYAQIVTVDKGTLFTVQAMDYNRGYFWGVDDDNRILKGYLYDVSKTTRGLVLKDIPNDKEFFAQGCMGSFRKALYYTEGSELVLVQTFNYQDKPKHIVYEPSELDGVKLSYEPFKS